MDKKLLTLCLIQQDDKILLGLSKRGKGEGKWNGFGGKVEEGESIEDATKREVLEECGLIVSDLEKIAVLDFTLPGEEKIWQTHVFKTSTFTGEPSETAEMTPKWFIASEVPFDSMWPDDVFWYPLFLQGKRFEGRFVFDDEYKITEHKLSVIPASEPESRKATWIPDQVRDDNENNTSL